MTAYHSKEERPNRAPTWFLIAYPLIPVACMAAWFAYGYLAFDGIWGGAACVPLGFTMGGGLALVFGRIVDPLHERRRRS